MAPSSALRYLKGPVGPETFNILNNIFAYFIINNVVQLCIGAYF
jgi:hypothetical protein